MNIDCIIYSKDRTLQLDLLIRSLKKNFKNLGMIWVMYDYSNDSFRKSFEKISDQDNVNFIKQDPSTFATILKDLVTNRISTEFVLPLCDDDFMPIETDLSEAVKSMIDDVCGINLRYHPKLCINYHTGDRFDPPTYEDRPFPTWAWETAGPPFRTSWSYPYQAGCQLYRRSEFADLVNNTSFILPNSLETAIGGYAWSNWKHKTMLMSMHDQHIINISINKVQNENGNRGGRDIHYSVGQLNEVYESGREIDLEYCECYCESNFYCDFIEMPLEFKDRI